MRSLAAVLVLSALAGCMHKEVAASPRPAAEPAPLSPPAVRPVEPSPRPQATAPSRSWTPTGSFARARFSGEMRKLRDGRVLYAGGFVGTARGMRDVDLFDPSAGLWTPGAPLLQGRYHHVVEMLADGCLLVTGGFGPSGEILDTAEIYDPRADRWTRAAPMRGIREGHRMVLLPDGRVLAVGGWDGSHKLATSEIYDPVKNTWTDAGRMSAIRSYPVAILLRSGKVLVAGGSGFASCDLYDPGTGRWSKTGSMSAPRWYHQGVTLSDGRVLVTGGGSGGDSAAINATSELYDPESGRWETIPMGSPRTGHAMVLVAGTPLVIGGQDEASYFSETEYFDAASKTWLPGPSLGEGRTLLRAAVLDDGRVLAAGGRAGLLNGAPLASSELLSAKGAFAYTPPAPRRRSAPPAAASAPPPTIESDGPDSLPPPVAARSNAHAIVIGVERYREGLPPAEFASADARLVAEYFRRVFGVQEENLAQLRDDRGTKSDFEKYFERWLPNRVEKGDDVYVYFSGHGSPAVKTGEAYLVPYDADPTYIEQTGYPLARMYEQLAKLPAKRVVVVMDSCFSGAGGRSVLASGARPLVSVVEQALPPGLIVISASAGDQISSSYQEKRHGLFTYFFLKGLKEKGGDLRAAYDYLKPEVSRVARRRFNSDQVPQWRAGR